MGDSPEAIRKAAAEKRWGIDVNGQPTLDDVVVGKHWPEPGHKGDGFTHIWPGDAWGQGVAGDPDPKPVPDPTPNLHIDQRLWKDVARMTDALGFRRMWPVSVHVQLGVELGVRVSLEAKGSARFDNPRLWQALGQQYDALGHPRFAMTLTDIGSPVRRLRAMKAAGFQTAILPRGKRPPDYLTKWAPVVDAVWGTDWNPIPT